MNTDPVVGDLDDHLIATSKAGDRTRGFVESLYLKPFWMTFQKIGRTRARDTTSRSAMSTRMRAAVDVIRSVKSRASVVT